MGLGSPDRVSRTKPVGLRQQGGHVRVSRWVIAAGVAALAATLVAGAAFGGSKAPAAQKAGYKAGLVGDVGTFNDNGFNKNQVLGIKAAAKAIHGKAYT